MQISIKDKINKIDSLLDFYKVNINSSYGNSVSETMKLIDTYDKIFKLEKQRKELKKLLLRKLKIEKICQQLDKM